LNLQGKMVFENLKKNDVVEKIWAISYGDSRLRDINDIGESDYLFSRTHFILFLIYIILQIIFDSYLINFIRPLKFKTDLDSGQILIQQDQRSRVAPLMGLENPTAQRSTTWDKKSNEWHIRSRGTVIPHYRIPPFRENP
jgi:hypothetical protein